ncbi:MAG: 30S ribosomal protein S6 [Candidatus Omnitrophota bacterium]
MRRMYESMLIIRVDLEPAVKDEICNKITGKIEALEGKIFNSKAWAKERSLCFPIRSKDAQKTKCFKGHYQLITFALDTEKLPDLKEVIRLEERIIRSIIFRKEGAAEVLDTPVEIA